MQFTFDNHTLDVGRRESLRAGAPISVQPQVFNLDLSGAESDRVVSKVDLIALVWDGRAVDIHQPDQGRADHYQR